MTKIIEKISLALIYIGTGAALLAPLFVDSSFFFPFISTRVFIFRLAVEIIFSAFLLLNLVSDKYRPRFNLVVILVGLYILIGAASSALGGNFYASFWGDMERGEGLILWLHLLVFLLILSGTFKSQKTWTGFLDFSVGVAILLSFFGLGQVFHLSSILATSGSRVDATFGNPAFFATYLLFHLAFAVYLFRERRSRWLKGYYLAAALLFIFLIIATETRGAVIGLAAGILFAAGLYAYLYRQSRAVKLMSGAVVVFILLAGLSIYLFRGSAWIKDSPKLRRLASISRSERTAQTRLLTWRAAWDGWQEKFWLGWGLENFDVVFNKYFPPLIYEDAGSQVWFDRAHNVIFDRGTSTGLLGLAAFLLTFFYPLYHFLRRDLWDPEKRAAVIIFSGFIVAYLIQDLFIFETINVYIIMFFTLAFWSGLFLPEYRGVNLKNPKYLAVPLFLVYAAALWPILQKVNLYPAKINLLAATALRSDPQEEDFFVIVERFKKALEPDNYGQQEYRLQFIEFVGTKLANLGEVAPEVKPVLAYADEQVERQLAADPLDAKNHLLAMRHYNFTFASDSAAKVARLDKALSFYPILTKLTPTRPHIHQEAGYTHLYFFRNYRENGDQVAAEEHFEQAEDLFKKTIDLQPKVIESHVNLIMLYLNGGKTEAISSVIARMDGEGLSWRTQSTLARLSNLAKGNQNYFWIAFFSEEMTKLNPDNIDAWIELALAYAYMGDVVHATEAAERIKQFGEPYISEANQFLENLRVGRFRNP